MTKQNPHKIDYNYAYVLNQQFTLPSRDNERV